VAPQVAGVPVIARAVVAVSTAIARWWVPGGGALSAQPFTAADNASALHIDGADSSLLWDDTVNSTATAVAGLLWSSSGAANGVSGVVLQVRRTRSS
jgi:hypothetical protein